MLMAQAVPQPSEWAWSGCGNWWLRQTPTPIGPLSLQPARRRTIRRDSYRIAMMWRFRWKMRIFCGSGDLFAANERRTQTAIPRLVMSEPTPDKVVQLITGSWAAAILGSAPQPGVFNALEGDDDNAEGVAQKTGISVRGAQAVLEGLTGVGLLTYSNGRYRNSPEASTFLVKGKPAYLGGLAEVMTGSLADWAKLPESVKTGKPAASITTDMADNEFWHLLVPAIAALSFPVAKMAAERLSLPEAGTVSWLDVGGGSGIWSAVWLSSNKQARGFQLDWPVVNQIAKGFVGNFGVADRFDTIDGDFHTTDFGSAKYDFAIYS